MFINLVLQYKGFLWPFTTQPFSPFRFSKSISPLSCNDDETTIILKPTKIRYDKIDQLQAITQNLNVQYTNRLGADSFKRSSSNFVSMK